MKIEEIKISGLRSHRGDPPTLVNLAGKSLVAIVGPTGAGKSSVLEAICFALYGEATFGGKAYRELSSDGRSEISVQMSFTVGSDSYQLVRTVAPNRNGVFGAKATWLRKVDDDGKALTHTDQVRKVDLAIRGLLGGMDRVQFCQAVLLAQNRFAELLETDERKRLQLLDILLGLTALADARKALQTTDRAVQRNEERLRDRRMDLPADPAAAAAFANARAAAMAELAQQAGAGANSLRGLVDKAGDAAEEVRALSEAAALRVAGADGYERLVGLISTLDALVVEEQRIGGELRTAARAKEQAAAERADAQRALEATEREHGRAGTHNVVTQQLAEFGRLLADRRSQQAALDDADHGIQTLGGELEAARAIDISAGTDLTKEEEAARAATEFAEAARNSVAAREQDVDAGRQLAGQLTGLITDLGNALDKLIGQEAALTPAAKALSAADAEWRQSAQDLKKAEQAASAAAAAHEHHPGDPCPVCQRDLPEGWKPPESPDLEEAQLAGTRTKEAFDGATAAHSKATERRAGAAGAFATAASNVTTKLGELTQMAQLHDLPAPPELSAASVADDVPDFHAHALADQANSLLEPLGNWKMGLEDLLSPLQEAAARAAAGSEKREAERAAAQKAATDASGKVAKLEAKRAASAQERMRAGNALEATRMRVKALQDEIPQRWASLVAPDAPDPVQAAQESVIGDKETVTVTALACERAEQALHDAEGRISFLKEEKSGKVDQPFAAASGGLDDITTMVKLLIRMVGISAPQPVPEPTTAAEALEAGRATQVLADEARSAAHARIDVLEDERIALTIPARNAVEALLDLKVQTDPDGTTMTAALDPEAPLDSATLEAVQQLVGAANTAATAAKSEAEKAKTQVNTVKELDKRLRALAKWRADLAGATEVLKKENFPAWARDRRITELVDMASELLSGMTGGRYRFDNHLRISDEIAGAVRPATTLSGGEKFEAALALALGVAEIAGRSGIRFDTLFLDEGFAGLDQQNLDRALDALEAEVSQGRRVVLITHIGAVADRIKDVLYIEPDGLGGSKTRWLTEEERFELGADLDLAESRGTS